MKRYLLLPSLLIAALLCYFAGLVNGSLALCAIGAVLEMNFWFRLFRRRHQVA